MKGKFIVLLISFATLISACSKDKRKLVGWWAIDVIRIGDANRLVYLSVNSMVFDNNGEVSLPRYDFKGSENGTWEIEKDEDDRYLVIKSSNNILARRYRLFYFKDPKNKVYRMSLQSDSIVMVCTKGLQVYH
ncbi:hypothetical protein DVR12_27030 [Chitinophaga silvatica]|uniref:Lipocalin-like domain-containing protein n=1 Tax=Chitinophaga silvatica TaxID=2282649 RepID=A0A3E1Y1Z5_9BACT|nr:hypothetical protein [Chitinophaga silvatica]RFS18702.1 hypothetical protein DVR12_27030 [Chitinophaga silvatica]